MKKSSLSNYLLFIGAATLFTIMVAIIQRSYSNLIEPINQVRTSAQIKPIDPNLDIETLDEIEKKKEYTENEIIAPTPITESPQDSDPAAGNPVSAPTAVPTSEDSAVSKPASQSSDFSLDEPNPRSYE